MFNRLTSTTSTERPKEIRVALGGHRGKYTIGQNNLHGKDLVGGQTVDTAQRRVSTSKNVTSTDTNGLEDEVRNDRIGPCHGSSRTFPSPPTKLMPLSLAKA